MMRPVCTVITLQRPGHAWPLLLAANRDERLDRPWDPPGAHWPGTDIVAGRDRMGGGSWMGVNGTGVVAAVLNRQGSLGPAAGKRSRGELPLLALREPTAAAAATAIAALDGSQYRTFNMVVASRDAVWFIRNRGQGESEAYELPPGLHMVTAHDPDDLASPRVAMHLPRFAAAPAPAPPDWSSWATLLAERAGPLAAALTVPDTDGFGTVCSALLALPAAGPPQWQFAAAGALFRPVAPPQPHQPGGGDRGAGLL